MHGKGWLLRAGIGLVLWAVLLALAWAQELELRWDFPASFTPAPASFLFTMWDSHAPTALTQFRVPNQGRASCEGVAQTAELTEDSVCGRTPTCLPPGLYSFWVQAEGEGGQRSKVSNVASCEAEARCLYTCSRLLVPPEVQALVATLTGDPQEVITDLAGEPTPVGTPRPAPTVDDVVDSITPALQQLPAST
jgi:hypothetical protein